MALWKAYRYGVLQWGGGGARGGHKSAVPDATEVREGQTEALTGCLNPPLLFSTLGCVSLYHPLKPDLGFPLWFPCLFLVTLVPPKVISQGSGHLPLTFFNLELGPWGSMQWWPFIVSSIQPRMIYQCEVVQISLACGHVHGGLFFKKKIITLIDMGRSSPLWTALFPVLGSGLNEKQKVN